jgi:acetoin utilization deacetylase AcuC-like enzyme
VKVFYTLNHRSHSPDSFFFPGQLLPFSPDPPDRAETIRETLSARGYTMVEGGDRGLEPIEQVHTPRYLDFLSSAWDEWTKEVAEMAPLVGAPVNTHVYPFIFPSHGRDITYPGSFLARAGYHTTDMWTPIGEGTWDAACWSASLAVEAADAVLAGEAAAYALCRPSGHHADADRGGGNTYLNNAAIAADRLRHGGCAKVAMIDIDVHHGNGTQGIFYDRDDVLTISIHGDPSDLYPYFVGYEHEVGEARGHGFNLNLPVATGSAIDPYLGNLDVAVERVKAYAPDALVVSLGVDAYVHDISANLQLSSDGFRIIGERLATLRLPTVLVQEGGYHLETLGDNVDNVLQAFAQVG